MSQHICKVHLIAHAIVGIYSMLATSLPIVGDMCSKDTWNFYSMFSNICSLLLPMIFGYYKDSMNGEYHKGLR